MLSRAFIENDINLEWFVDEFIYFRGIVHVSGWTFHRNKKLIAVGYLIRGQNASEIVQYEKLDGYGMPSLDVEGIHGGIASNCRFSWNIQIESVEEVRGMELVCVLDDGQAVCIKDFAQRKISTDPYHLLHKRFFEMLSVKSKGSVLEIGSRNRSGFIRRNLIPSDTNYIGMDIKSGENVDIVGDAHDLTRLFKSNTFDAIFTMSVFEHLLMPWKVAIEMNRIMKAGGLVLITSHHTFPLHEVPWDFWRFSDQAWHGLFNQFTGFEVISTAVGEPAAVVATMSHSVTFGLEDQPAYLASAVLCRKTQDTELSWDVDVSKILKTMYPN